MTCFLCFCERTYLSRCYCTPLVFRVSFTARGPRWRLRKVGAPRNKSNTFSLTVVNHNRTMRKQANIFVVCTMQKQTCILQKSAPFPEEEKVGWGKTEFCSLHFVLSSRSFCLPMLSLEPVTKDTAERNAKEELTSFSDSAKLLFQLLEEWLLKGDPDSYVSLGKSSQIKANQNVIPLPAVKTAASCL